MLEEIRIAGLGVIAEASVPLDRGLTVLTGETGAGKTMLLSALDLLFGGRADTALVRSGDTHAVAEGRLRLPAEHPAWQRALDAGAEPDEDGTLLVRRAVGAAGRSRASLGGASVPAGVLGEIAERLVAVHGQADQQRLTAGVRQRDVLDTYAGAQAAQARRRYEQAYRRVAQLRAEQQELESGAAEAAAESGRLREALERIEALGPQAGEEAELAAAVARLAHADAIRAAVGAAHDGLAVEGDDGAYGALAAAARALGAAADLDPGLTDLARRAAEVVVLVGDVSSDLAAYADGLEADPDALARAQDRQAALLALLRAHVPEEPTAAALLAWSGEAALRHAALEDSGERRRAVGAERAEAEEALAAAARTLHDVRVAAAGRLARAVGAEFAGLAMPGARLEVRVDPAEAGPDGADHVAFLLAAHPDAPPRPLGRGASGGELSRVMLALEVVLAGADPVPTMVFDEVDAGVGGEAAVEIGVRLARLARHHQVLVVTHLPQVAAYADRHVVVRRGGDGDQAVGRSDVSVLDEEGRVTELARMLGGLGDSEAARTHARELLARAADART